MADNGAPEVKRLGLEASARGDPPLYPPRWLNAPLHLPRWLNAPLCPTRCLNAPTNLVLQCVAFGARASGNFFVDDVRGHLTKRVKTDAMWRTSRTHWGGRLAYFFVAVTPLRYCSDVIELEQVAPSAQVWRA